MDRFGLRILVRGLEEPDDRLEAYNRAKAYINNPRQVVDHYAENTITAREEIDAARELLPEVVLPEKVAKMGLKLIDDLDIVSLRAEISTFESARALAAADGRKEVSAEDLKQVAPMTLRLRRSPFITKYFEDQEDEEKEISQKLENLPSV